MLLVRRVVAGRALRMTIVAQQCNGSELGNDIQLAVAVAAVTVVISAIN